jgi:hypothetical protein
MASWERPWLRLLLTPQHFAFWLPVWQSTRGYAFVPFFQRQEIFG